MLDIQIISTFCQDSPRMKVLKFSNLESKQCMSGTWWWSLQISTVFLHFIIQNAVGSGDSSVGTVCVLMTFLMIRFKSQCSVSLTVIDDLENRL